MEREKRLMSVGAEGRHSALLSVLRGAGYTVTEEYSHAVTAVILPMPYSQDKDHITGSPLTVAELFSALPEGTAVLGGLFRREAYLQAGERGLRLFDYFTPERVQIANAALTAKGAIAMAEEELRRAQSVLVCGFGRIGRCLMNELTKKGKVPTVSLRRDTDAAWAEALNYRWIPSDSIKAKDYDLIFNTVPHPILTEDKLRDLREGSMLVELASPPYGIDLQAAERPGVRTVLASGLPGRLYPDEAGRILGESALRILREAVTA